MVTKPTSRSTPCRARSLGSADVKWTKVCDRADLVTEFAVHGDDIYLLTAHDAPRFKVVRTSLAAARICVGGGRRSAERVCRRFHRRGEGRAVRRRVGRACPTRCCVPYDRIRSRDERGNARSHDRAARRRNPRAMIESANADLPGS